MVNLCFRKKLPCCLKKCIDQFYFVLISAYIHMIRGAYSVYI